MDAVLLNFSGHPLSKKAYTELEQHFDKIEELPFFEIDFSQSVEDQLRKLVGCVSYPLDGSISVTIIPPGHSTVAVLLVVYLHGSLGYFPGLCLLESKEIGQYLPTNTFQINSQKIRAAGRLLRQEIWRSRNS
jgi:hypothetical protein